MFVFLPEVLNQFVSNTAYNTLFGVNFPHAPYTIVVCMIIQYSCKPSIYCTFTLYKYRLFVAALWWYSESCFGLGCFCYMVAVECCELVIYLNVCVKISFCLCNFCSLVSFFFLFFLFLFFKRNNLCLLFVFAWSVIYTGAEYSPTCVGITRIVFFAVVFLAVTCCCVLDV